MRISTSKMVVSDSKVKCILWFEVVPRVEEFKYLEVLFLSG